MQFVTRVLLLALAVCSANAWPRTSGEVAVEQSLLRMVMQQMSASLMDSRALSPAETACINYYNNATNKIVDDLSNATSKCEEAANRTTVTNNNNGNATSAVIRQQLLTLESNLQRCRNETDNLKLINCTVSYFDANLHLLDTSNSLAYQTQSEFASNSTEVQTQRSNCIRAAVSQSKVKSIEAANDYDTCLGKIPQQRELIQEQQSSEIALNQQQQQPQPFAQLQQQPMEQPQQPQQLQQPQQVQQPPQLQPVF